MFVSGKYKSHFRYFARTASKMTGGGGAQPSGVGWCTRSHFLFFIFFFFSSYYFLSNLFFSFFLSIFISILFSSLYFSFYFVIVFQDIVVIYVFFNISCLFIVFCCFFVLAIVVWLCRIRFKRIYLRSVAFKLFFGVVGSLMCFYALRSEINGFLLFLCFSLQIFLCFCDFVFFLI